MIREAAEKGSAGGRIDSPGNSQIKALRRLLTSAEERRSQGRYLVEGPRLVLAALDAEAPVERLYLAPELCRSQAVLQRIAGLEREPGAPPLQELSARAFSALSQRDGPTGIAALLRRSEASLDRVTVAPQAPVVAAWDLADPGNLGSLLRLLEAVGAAALLLCGDAGTDPEHPTAVKASMGALFRVPTLRVSGAETLAWARARGMVVVATSAKGVASHWAEEDGLPALQDRPTLLLLGSERQGLPPDLLAQADRTLRIPMAGSGTSLNVTVAAGILLYELRRRRLP